MAARLELLKEQFFDDNGAVLSGGLLYTYVVGTTTEKATYTTLLGDVAQANPIVLDSAGRIPSDLYGVGAYKFVIKDSAGTTIDTIPTVSGANSRTVTSIGDYSGDLDAAITAIGATATTLLIDDTATMSVNTTVPATCKILVEKGGTINQSTFTLTLNGPIEAGPYQVFTGTGTVNINANNKINADWFGSGKNDTTLTAMQSMIGSSNGHTVIVSAQAWSITDDFTLTDNFTLEVPQGCVISVSAAKTLTLPTRPIAGEYQIFSGSGTVSFTNYGGYHIFPQWWYSGSGYWTTAIQAAIDSVAADGGEVVLPPGEYQIDDTLVMENPGLLFRGLGGSGNSHAAEVETNMGAIITNKSGDADAILIGKDATYLSDIVLKDFTLDGDSGTATDGNGIVLDSFGYDPSGVSSVKMYNISIHHVEHYGLYLLGNVFECSLHGCEFRYNEYGVYADGTDHQISQISFHGCQFWYSTEAGFYKSTGVSDITFHGCRFGYNDVGALAALTSTFTGCTFEANTTTGVQFGAYNVRVYSCTFATNGTAIDGVDSGGGHGVIIGAYFTGNTTDIDIPNGCRSTIVGGIYGASDTLVLSNADRTTTFLDTNFETLTEAGAARTYGITEFNSTAGPFAVTLANGTAIAQWKIFKFDTDNGDVTLTVAAHETSSPEVFTFDDAGDYLELRWTGAKWCTIKNYGVATP